jgi:hypothetical protein
LALLVLIIILLGMGLKEAEEGMEVATERVEVLAMEEVAEKVPLEELVELGVMALLVLIITLLGMDPEEVEVVMEVAKERAVVMALEGAAEKVPLVELGESVELVELEEMALLALIIILLGMDPEEVEVAMERLEVAVMEEGAEKDQLVELGELEELVESEEMALQALTITLLGTDPKEVATERGAVVAMEEVADKVPLEESVV